MVVMIIIASVLALAFLVVRVTEGTKGVYGGVVAMFVKTLASLGFIAIGIAALYSGVDNVQAAVFVLAGLIFGLIGDMVLDLKVVYLKSPEEEVYLTGGMASFALGHIMFFTAMCLFMGSTASMTLIGICVAIAAVLAFAMVFGGDKLMGFKFGKFTIHSLVYGFLLIFMVAFSIGLCITLKSTKVLLFTIGMVLFFLSDLVLTSMYFGGRAKDKTLCVINHVLYYAAQICIATYIYFM